MMHHSPRPTRRSLLLFGGAAALSPLFARDSGPFWDRKGPGEWTDNEVDRLVTESPWARQVKVSMYQAVGPAPKRSRWSIPGLGGVGGGDGSVQFEATVRWESAEPVLKALRTTLPGALADYYVIGVHGIPLEYVRADDNIAAKLRDTTRLGLKGQSTLRPEEAMRIHSPHFLNVMFGFPKASLTASPDAGDLTFSTLIGRSQIQAVFQPREMLYRGALAL